MLFMVTVGCEGYTARDKTPFRPSNNSPFRQHLKRVSFYSVSMYGTSIAYTGKKINTKLQKRYGAVAFRHNRIKNAEVLCEKTQYLCYNFTYFREIKVENLWFSSFLCVFYSTAVSVLRRMYIRLSVGERRFLL